MPQTCVITGEAATEKHVVKGFTGTPYYIGKSELELPFSANGWKFFRRKFPTSLFLFKAGLNVLMAIPFFAIFTWTPIVGFFCGLIALIEYPMGRRQLLFPVAVNVKGDCLVGIDLWGVSKEFAEDFLALNTTMSLSDYLTGYRKRNRIILTATIILVCAALLFLAAMIFLYKNS